METKYVHSVLGWMTFRGTKEGLCAAFFGREEETLGPSEGEEQSSERGNAKSECVGSSFNIEEAVRAIESYFRGEKCAFSHIPLVLKGTKFQCAVWEALKGIPFGETVSYQDLAKSLGEGSARSVGGAVGRNPLCVVLPCHRVVGKDGQLRGYRGGSSLKALGLKTALLQHEGAL